MLMNGGERNERRASTQRNQNNAPPPPSQQSQSSIPSTSATLMATQGYQTAYQNPTFLGNTPITDIQGFVGPSASGVDKHATGHVTVADLNGKTSFGKEFAHSVQQTGRLDTEEGGVGPLDEPGKWLIDTGASNHYSPFKHLFLHPWLGF